MLGGKNNIVPRNYRKFKDDDSDSEFSDEGSSNNSDKMSISSDDNNELDKIENMQNNTKYENRIVKRNKFCETDTWGKQFDKMTFDNGGHTVSSNSINDTSDLVKRNELERNFELANDFSKYEEFNNDGTLGIVDANSPGFIHENMKPFVRRGPNAIHEAKRNMVNNMKLETFTGNNDPMWKKKIERTPLFEPITNASNLYGDPVRTDEMQSRYFAGKYTNNDLPFQQVKVTPGLDIGYNGVGKHGYHDMYRVVPRTTNELRPLSKPKVSYGSYSGPSVAQNPNGAIIGTVSQYKAPTFSERGTADMIKGGKSYISAPTIYGNYDKSTLATDNRGVKSNVVIGVAQANTTGITPGKYRANYAPSRKENYLNDTQRNVVGYESFAGQGHNSKAFVSNTTLRDINNVYDRAGNIQGGKHGYQAINYDDTPDMTMRNINDTFDRAGQIQGNRYEYKAINYEDTPENTKRNIHENFDRAGQIQGNRYEYKAINYEDMPDITKRNSHNEYDRTGQVGGNRYEYKAINYEDIPDITKRNIHNEYDRTGQIQGNRYEHKAINYEDTPDITKRNIHNEYDRAGQIQGNSYEYKAINYKDTPDITKRNIHENFDRAGQVQGDKYGYKAINYEDTPDITKRNIHENTERAGQIQGDKYGYQAINYEDTPDITKRNIHENSERAGQIQGDKYGYQAIDYNDTPNITKRNIHEKTERAGHIQGDKYGYQAIDYNDTPNITKRNIHERTERAGHIGNGSRKDYKAINYDDVPDATMREIHTTEIKGHSKHFLNNQGSRRQYSNMMVNGAKEALEEGRAPTKVGVNKGWTLDNTVMRLRNPLKITWRPAENSSMPYSNNRVPAQSTHVLMEKRSWNNDRINMYPELNLQGNEFVNNLVHKAV
jgi:hypothetical protein